MMLFRLILVTFLLGSAVVVNVNDVESFCDPSYVAIVSLIIATYVATLGYVAWIRRPIALVPLAYVQIVGDVVLAAGLVFLTGGIDSIFSFLFFLTIFNGAVLTGRRGAVFGASGSSLGLAAIAIVQFAQLPAVYELFPDLMPRADRLPIYAMVIHLVAFYTVAFLSGYLAEKIGQMGTELAARQVDLKELRALNENIVRSISSGLVTLDLQGRVIFSNRAAESVLGFAADRVRLVPLGEAVPQLAEIVEQLRARPLSDRTEWRFERADGSVVYLGVSVSTLRSVEGRQAGSILIFQDLTEVRALRQEITRQQSLAAIGNLSASIAHEIRNPLAAISGSIEMLDKLLQLPEEERQLMAIVIREVDRLNDLIKDFLDYARPRSIERRQVAALELIDETVRIFRQDAERAAGVTVTVSHGDEAEAVMDLDASRLQQVVWNLLRNAADAVGEGGTITVKTAWRRDRAGARTHWVVTFDDNGPGIPPEVLDKLFEPFFTTKSDGTGLGLATSHRIVAEHGGVLRAANREEGGARFSIVLPVDEQTVPSARAVRDAGSSDDGRPTEDTIQPVRATAESR